MSELSGAMQQRIAPPVAQYNSIDFSSAKVDNQTERKNSTEDRTDFRDLIANSMENVHKEREAKKLGDLSAGSEAEFFEKLAEQTKPQREVKKEMDKDDFLKLFVAQLQNQDPLNPDDGTEMASKLAQFNGLEQMMNMNKTMEQMMKSQNVGRNLQLVNYVGKEISVDGGRIRLRDGEATKTEFSVTVPASRASLTIRDSTGMTVSERELGPLELGEHPFVWDGKNDAGNSVSDGLYHFSIYAQDIEGNQVPIPITSKTIISGVNIQSEGGDLYTDLGNVKFDDIRSVGNPGYDNQRPADKAKQQISDAAAKEVFEARKAEKAIAAEKAKNTTNQGPTENPKAVTDTEKSTESKKLDEMKSDDKKRLSSSDKKSEITKEVAAKAPIEAKEKSAT